MKKQNETISVDITVEHYGFYHSDEHFGNEHKPYRDWLVKKADIKSWDDYSSGMCMTDVEMIDDGDGANSIGSDGNELLH